MEIDDMWDDDEDRVTVLGERADGSREVVGTAPMPPKMKMREIVRNYFGEPTCGPDDCDEASMCMYALESYHEWLLKQGWTAPPLVVTPNGEVRGASRPAGEASSAEGATSTVVLCGADLEE